MKINEKIKLMRQLKAFSQEEMADKLGLSLNGYANIERGETDVQLSRLEQIAGIFEMDLLELFAYGDRAVTCLIGDNFSFNRVNCTNTGDSKETDFEIQKLHLLVDQQVKEIAYLKEIIELMKVQRG
jgi:transcriptional regulator with XRE-family HTH domain